MLTHPLQSPYQSKWPHSSNVHFFLNIYLSKEIASAKGPDELAVGLLLQRTSRSALHNLHAYDLTRSYFYAIGVNMVLFVVVVFCDFAFVRTHGEGGVPCGVAMTADSLYVCLCDDQTRVVTIVLSLCSSCCCSHLGP